ncbi:MAG TPA: phage antirepressor N-terminal domain-containing protein [Pseudoneobacillus sp.]|nr:phage antirepressor N-terminal domain-containing protein [Pseudoneobacillus sp.]
MSLMIKEVHFNNDNLLAIKDKENEKVYVAVRFVCDNLGMTEGQQHHQTTKISEDIVLSQGVRKIVLPTKGGNQEVICLELDYLPLWLAKMNAGIVKDTATREKLISYQLKAKDVLAAAFVENKPMCIEDLIIMQATALKEMRQQVNDLEQKVTAVTHRINSLDNVNITGDPRQKLNNMVRKLAQVKGMPYDEAWRSFRTAYNTAFRTNIKMVATNYAKKNNIRKVTVPEVLEMLNKLDDGIRVADKMLNS